MTTSIEPTNPTSFTISLPTRCKLMKTCFLQIPTGAYLISNCHANNGQPVFAERVVVPGNRQQQWQRIVKVRAAHRFCLITNSEADFKTMSGAFPRDPVLTKRLLERRLAVVSRVHR